MEYFPGDTVRIIHTDSGMQFPECKVYVDEWSSYVVDMMAMKWIVESDHIFESFHPNFHLELVSRNDSTT